MESGHRSTELSRGPVSVLPKEQVGDGIGASVHGWATDGLRFGVSTSGVK